MDMNSSAARDDGRKQDSGKTQSETDTPKLTPPSTQPHQLTLQHILTVLQPANKLSHVAKRIATYSPPLGYRIFASTPARAKSIINKYVVRIHGVEELSGLAKQGCVASDKCDMEIKISKKTSNASNHLAKINGIFRIALAKL